MVNLKGFAKMNVYSQCPQFENDAFLLRLTSENDVDDLLKVYSDKNAVRFFNSDNCHGDDFYYTTLQRMQSAVQFWIEAYSKGWFVRWSVIDKKSKEVIGTIEEFLRKEDDYFTDCILLRLDLRSDYEKTEYIEQILSLIVKPSFNMFGGSMLATKTFNGSNERVKALDKLKFVKSKENLLGFDGTKYGGYYIFKFNNQ